MASAKPPKPRPRTPDERAKLLAEVKARVMSATPEQRAAFEMRRAIAQAEHATKH